jgi:hypothetical protein
MPKNKNKRKPKGRIQKRAARDIRVSQQPLVDQLERSMGATQSAYGGYQDLLGGMQGQYGQQTGDISQDLMNQYSQLAGMLGGAAPPTEAGAANQLFGGAGAGALGILASDQQRNVDFQRSAQREGGLASRYSQDNLIQQMNELYAQRPQLIRQRTDELRDQSLERQLAQSQIASDEAFNQYLQNQIGGLLGGGGGRSGGGGGGSTVGAGRGNTLPPSDTSVGGNQGVSPNSFKGETAIRNFLSGYRDFEDMRPRQQRRVRKNVLDYPDLMDFVGSPYTEENPPQSFEALLQYIRQLFAGGS